MGGGLGSVGGVGALRELAKEVDTSEVSLAGIAPRGYEPGKVVASEGILGSLAGR